MHPLKGFDFDPNAARRRFLSSCDDGMAVEPPSIDLLLAVAERRLSHAHSDGGQLRRAPATER